MFIGCLLSAQPATAVTPKRPNILFFFADDQRADTIHALGNPLIQTLNLDRLVQDGSSFTHAYSMGGNHGSVGISSRAMLLSSRTLFRIDEQLLSGPLLPTVFQENGYTTFGCGKWHNGIPSFARSFAKGGAIFFGATTDQYHPQFFSYDPFGRYDNRRPRMSDKYSTDAIGDEVVRFLREHRPSRPFFCYVGFTVPHDPRTPFGRYAAMYNSLTLPLPKSFLPEHPFNNGDMNSRDEKLLAWPRSPDAVRKETAAYYGMISHMDDQIGRILDVLRESQQNSDTIVVFTSNQGIALGAHGLLGKQNLYEDTVRVPLILAGPGIPRNRREDSFCYLIDLFPTLCDLVKLPKPAELEGQSFLPELEGKPTGARKSIFCAYRDVQRSVRDETWKMIRYPQINKTQLFKLDEDPDELRDLSDDAKYADEITRLTALLKNWQQKLGDSVPLTTDHPQPLRVKLGDRE
jgi:arylsulfatase A-like enzyme